MTAQPDLSRSLHPLWQQDVDPPATARDLTCDQCRVDVARHLIAAWHSRLPRTQRGPWQHAFAAHRDGYVYAVALWHNPSARGLPSHWLELRRMAVAPDAPHCTASWFLARMAAWFRANAPERERMISYQDCDVHTGTIYKAAGWEIGAVAAARTRDRTPARVGTRRAYRSNLNGTAPDGAAKQRWEKPL